LTGAAEFRTVELFPMMNRSQQRSHSHRATCRFVAVGSRVPVSGRHSLS